jgi:excisionase family DNA binding protein
MLLYTLEDLAALFKVSRSTIYRRRKQDNWPHLQIGSEFRFTPEDVEQIIALYRKETPTKETRSRPNVGTKAKRRNQ